MTILKETGCCNGAYMAESTNVYVHFESLRYRFGILARNLRDTASFRFTMENLGRQN